MTVDFRELSTRNNNVNRAVVRKIAHEAFKAKDFCLFGTCRKMLEGTLSMDVKLVRSNLYRKPTLNREFIIQGHLISFPNI